MNKPSIMIVFALVLGFFFSGSGDSQTIKDGNEFNWQFDYNEGGLVTKLVDPGGKITRLDYEYDPQNQHHLRRIVRTTAGNRQTSFEFDTFGRRLAMSDAAGTVRYVYDDLGRLKTMHRGTNTVSYTYDTMGRLRSICPGAGFTIRYSRDFLGRLEKIQTPAGDVQYTYYTADGLIRRTLPNGIYTIWQYLPGGNLESISHVSKDNYLIHRFTYTYRPDGLIRQIQEWTPQGEFTLTYDYDAARRLSSYSDSQIEQFAYLYDNSGNRTELRPGNGHVIASTYDWAGRILTFGDMSCSHDASGNLTSFRYENDPGTFEYDGLNLLTKVNNGEVLYEYDGDGHLIARIVDKVRTTFVPDPFTDAWHPLLAIDDQGKITYYIWEKDLVLGEITGDQVKWYLHDYQGSVRCVSDGYGQVIARQNYQPFGSFIGELSQRDLIPGFAGSFFDPVASLYLTGVRAYEPNLARFLQCNPALTVPTGLQKDLSHYSYCGNDPINYLDVNGADPYRIEYDYASTFNRMPEITGLTFHDRVRNYVNYCVNYFNIQPGEEIGIVFSGSNNRFDDAWNMTIENFASGDKIILIPTFGGNFQGGKQLDVIQTVTDYLTTSVPKGFPNVSISLIPVTINTRKIGVPELLNNFDQKNIRVRALVFSNGANLVLQSNISDLIRYATNHATLPRIGTLSGGISSVHADKLMAAGYVFNNLGEHGLVEALQQRWSDFAPFRIAPPGAPGYFCNVIQVLATQGPQGMLLKDRIAGIVRGHGYRARRDLANDFINNSITEYQTISRELDRWDKICDALINQERTYRPFAPGSDGAGGLDHGRSEQYAPYYPSNVGGIYLRGADAALGHLGCLTGIALDDNNGRLILLSEDNKKIDLPPLHLDDFVTVFRCIYNHGRAPYVSIEPDSADPYSPIMHVRYGPGLRNTYVGWILFEADRVMKTYSMGYDNITREPVITRVAGYQNLFDMGFSSINDNQATTWERFWIVPARVTRNESKNSLLTLLEVPLKVNTQKMVLNAARLEPASDDTPSPEAELFSTWFTENYNNIAREALSQPPGAAGGDTTVSCYQELRNIALVTAIAQALYEQGVPMPNWMQNYPIPPCPTPDTIKAIGVEASKEEIKHVVDGNAMRLNHSNHRRHVYGGVTLAPGAREIQIFKPAPAAEILAPVVKRALETRSMVTTAGFTNNGSNYQALALPGNESRDLAACRLQEVDLIVPVQRGTAITLVRKFNSFFEPDDIFGRPWTLDLPTLKIRTMPKKFTGDATPGTIVYQIISPFASYFENVANLFEAHDERIGYKTKMFILPNGQNWHFDSSGNLVAIADSPLFLVYRRDGAGQVYRIEGWYGKYLRADIQLSYNYQNLVEAAVASNREKVRYTYNEDGILIKVVRSTGVIEYGYDNGRVCKILWNGVESRRFDYNEKGQLVREKLADGSEINYQVKYDSTGYKILAASQGSLKADAIVQYDTCFRPVNHIFNDGSQIQWQYENDNRTKTLIQLSTGERYVIDQAPDGKFRSMQLAGGDAYQGEYDDHGRLTRITRNQQQLFWQKWNDDNTLASIFYEDFAEHLKYRDDGVVTGRYITTPEAGPEFKYWLDLTYDESGRVEKITDYSGVSINFWYNRSGDLTAVQSKRGGVQLNYNEQGKLSAIETSWGQKQYNYYNQAGQLETIILSESNFQSRVEFNQNLPGRIQQFNGSELVLSYYDQGIHKDLLKEIQTTGTVLTYEYDNDNQLTAINCGSSYRLEYIRNDQGYLIQLRQVPVGT